MRLSTFNYETKLNDLTLDKLFKGVVESGTRWLFDTNTEMSHISRRSLMTKIVRTKAL